MAKKTLDSLDEILEKLNQAEKEFNEKMKEIDLASIIHQEEAKLNHNEK